MAAWLHGDCHLGLTKGPFILKVSKLYLVLFHQAGRWWMYWPKVLPVLLASRSAQKPETKDTGGVRLSPHSRSGPQGSPSAATFTRQPRRRQPGQDSITLPHLPSAAHRAGQVRWQISPVTQGHHLSGNGSFSDVCLPPQVVWSVRRVVRRRDSSEAGSVSSLPPSRV